MTCKEPNCDRQAVALGWCRGHWEAMVSWATEGMGDE